MDSFTSRFVDRQWCYAKKKEQLDNNSSNLKTITAGDANEDYYVSNKQHTCDEDEFVMSEDYEAFEVAYKNWPSDEEKECDDDGHHNEFKTLAPSDEEEELEEHVDHLGKRKRKLIQRTQTPHEDDNLKPDQTHKQNVTKRKNLIEYEGEGTVCITPLKSSPPRNKCTQNYASFSSTSMQSPIPPFSPFDENDYSWDTSIPSTSNITNVSHSSTISGGEDKIGYNHLTNEALVDDEVSYENDDNNYNEINSIMPEDEQKNDILLQRRNSLWKRKISRSRKTTAQIYEKKNEEDTEEEERERKDSPVMIESVDTLRLGSKTVIAMNNFGGSSDEMTLNVARKGEENKLSNEKGIVGDSDNTLSMMVTSDDDISDDDISDGDISDDNITLDLEKCNDLSFTTVEDGDDLRFSYIESNDRIDSGNRCNSTKDVGNRLEGIATSMLSDTSSLSMNIITEDKCEARDFVDNEKNDDNFISRRRENDDDFCGVIGKKTSDSMTILTTELEGFTFCRDGMSTDANNVSSTKGVGNLGKNAPSRNKLVLDVNSIERSKNDEELKTITYTARNTLGESSKLPRIGSSGKIITTKAPFDQYPILINRIKEEEKARTIAEGTTRTLKQAKVIVEEAARIKAKEETVRAVEEKLSKVKAEKEIKETPFDQYLILINRIKEEEKARTIAEESTRTLKQAKVAEEKTARIKAKEETVRPAEEKLSRVMDEKEVKEGITMIKTEEEYPAAAKKAIRIMEEEKGDHFPNRLSYRVTWERFNCLLPYESMVLQGKLRHEVDNLLATLLTEPFTTTDGATVTAYECGKTKVYFRTGALERLDNQRKAFYSNEIIIIQRWFRTKKDSWKFMKFRSTIISIQARSRGHSTLRSFHEKKSASIVLQAKYRGYIENKLYYQLKRTTIVLQSLYRCKLKYEIFCRMRKMTIRLQCWYRCMVSKQIVMHTISNQAAKIIHSR